MRITLIVAIAADGLIGTDTGLPWRLPADLKRFRRLTMGKPILMGRTTFEHIGRPLDGRLNIVLTRNPDFQPEGVQVARSWDDAVRLAGDVEELMVIGGSEVYRTALPHANRIELTIVEGAFAGTAYFPLDLPNAWNVDHDERFPADEKNPHPHRNVTLSRAESGGLSSIRELNGKSSDELNETSGGESDSTRRVER
jgi:dihydrofolate reductase